MTRQRMAIISALCRASAGLTPQSLYEEARAGYPRLGLATVYRTIDALDQCGCLGRLWEADGGDSLVAVTASHGHHALCKKCSRVVEFSTCELAETIAGACAKRGS